MDVAVVDRRSDQALTEVAPKSDTAMLMQMIERAVMMPDFSVDKLNQLLEVRERWESREAEKAFVAAMADFKKNPPQIIKDAHVEYQTSKGLTKYDHATLGAVCAAIIKGLADVGISHEWEPKQTPGRIAVTCILSHVRGHKTRTTLESAHDDSGGKNAIQALSSANSYLQRYTLLSATGFATMDDDDGRGAIGAGDKSTPEAVTPAGYAKWRADMGALADEGTDKLQAAWAGSSKDFRVHAVTHDGLWWASVKGKAGKVEVAS